MNPFREFQVWRLTAVFGFICGLAYSQVPVDPSKNRTAQLVPAEKLPRQGKFWSLQRTNSPPLPFDVPYLREAEAPVYVLDRERNVFVVDDSAFDYAALFKKREEQRQLRRLAWELGLLGAEEYWAEEGGACELRDAVAKLSATPQSAWTCPSCGEELEGQFGSCWKCGANRNVDD